MSRLHFESVHGYKILEAVGFDNDRGFAIAHNPNAVQPWVTWQYTDEQGQKNVYWGHYKSTEKSAFEDYNMRIADYKKDYPSLTEKFNYLAAAEMGAEQNYNSIDGIINNVQKPSILEQIREMEHKSAETATNKPGKSPEIER